MVKFLNRLLLGAIVVIVVYVAVTRYDILSQVSMGVLGSDGATFTQEGFINQVQEAMVLGEEELVLSYTGSGEELESFVTKAIEEAFDLDDSQTSSDFDYLKFKYAGVNVNMRGLGMAYKITYKFDYLESKEQTAIVDKRVDDILYKNDIHSKTNYEKIKFVHDYIIQNSTYDLTVGKNSAYSCLIEGASACQGYASLFYKMMTKAGIPCRIISGKGMNESHAWNIVKLNGSWYNIDCTWDDPVGNLKKDYVDYDFFLKNTADFLHHVRDKQYETEEFHQSYPMAKKSY